MVVLFTFFVCSLAGNLWFLQHFQQSQRQPHHYDIDKPFINAAINLWAEHAREPRNEVMKDRYAKAVYFKNEVCISLSLKLGAVGGVPVYCFRADSKKLIRKYDDVE